MEKLSPLHIIDITNIIFVGDVHGKYGDLGFLVKERHKITNSVFIAVGDIGLGFEKPGYFKQELGKLSRKLKHGGNQLFLMRGNHDNPSSFAELKELFDNITVVPDYSVINADNTKILCIGGAVSVDRTKRTPGKTYWYDEKIVFDEKKLKSFTDINIVATHSSPDFCFPLSKGNIQGWLLKDESLNSELNEERELLTKIFNILNKNNILTHWFYGHFHASFSEYFDKIHFFALNELEFVSI